MPQQTSCSACQRKLRIPDELLGRRVKCPDCGTTFTAVLVREPPASKPVAKVPAKPAPPRRDEDGEDDEPAPRRRDDQAKEDRPRPKKRRAAWRKVCSGLGYLVTAVWLGVAMYGVLIGGLLLTAVLARLTGSLTVLQIGTLIVGGAALLLSLGAIILYVLGNGFCAAAPAVPDSAVRPLAVTNFVLVCVMLLGVFGVAGTGLMASLAGGGVNAIVATVGVSALLLMAAVLAAVSQWIVFLVFLRSLGFAVRDRDLAASALFYLCAALAFVVLQAATHILLRAIFGPPPPGGAPGGAIGILVQVVFGLMGLGMMVWFLVLLTQARDSVDRFASRG